MGEARAVFRNAGALAAAQVIERVANAILLFALARSLGASGLGVYSGALAYFALIAVGGELGATSFLVREVSRVPARASEYLVHLGVVASVACGAVGGIVAAVVPFVGFAPTLATAVSLVMAAVIPGTLNVLQEGVFVAYQKAHIRTLVTFAGAVFNVTVSLLLLHTGHGVISVLVVFVATQYLVTGALFLAINRWLTPIRGPFHLATAWGLLRRMKAFIASSLLGALFSRPEIIILTLVASESEVGYYAGALKIVDLWYFLPATFAINLFPLLSRSHHEGRARMQEIQDKAMRFLLTFAFPISVATLVLSPQLVELAYGDALEPAVPVLRVLAFNVCLYALFELLWRVLSARNEQGAVLRVQSVTTVTRLGAGVALAVPFGAIGAAVSAVGNQVLHIVLLALSIRRDGTRIPISRIAWRPALAAGAMGLLAWLAVPTLGLIPTVACAAVVYVALAFGLGAISREDLALLRRQRVGPESGGAG
jgi:O-antigen/teichoic acid export membrane protein